MVRVEAESPALWRKLSAAPSIFDKRTSPRLYWRDLVAAAAESTWPSLQLDTSESMQRNLRPPR